MTHLYFTNEELTGCKGSWMNPVNRCCLTHSFFNRLFLNKKNCLWSWVKQEREIDSMPLTQEMMAKERSKFLAKQSTGWCRSFPCPVPPNQKVLKKVCQVIKPFSFQGDKLRGWSISTGEVHGTASVVLDVPAIPELQHMQEVLPKPYNLSEKTWCGASGGGSLSGGYMPCLGGVDLALPLGRNEGWRSLSSFHPLTIACEYLK